MPVTTRSQSKHTTQSTLVKVDSPLTEPKQHSIIPADPYKSDTYNKMRNIIEEIEKTSGETTKTKLMTKLYKLINQELPNELEKCPTFWIVYVATAYNKIIKLEKQLRTGEFSNITERTVNNLFKELKRAKKFTSDAIKKYGNWSNHPNVKIAQKNISETEPKQKCPEPDVDKNN